MPKKHNYAQSGNPGLGEYRMVGGFEFRYRGVLKGESKWCFTDEIDFVQFSQNLTNSKTNIK